LALAAVKWRERFEPLNKAHVHRVLSLQSSRGNGRVTPKIRNVLLAAPDVDIDLAREAIVDMGPRANRPAFTLFVSRDNRALAVSWGSEARPGVIDPDQEPYRTQLEQA